MIRVFGGSSGHGVMSDILCFDLVFVVLVMVWFVVYARVLGARFLVSPV